MSHALERRFSPRLTVVKNRSRIEFGTPSGQHRVAASMLDVSREGALIVAEEPLPLFERSWVRIEDPARTDWIATVAVRLGDSGHIGLRFIDPCPDDFLLAALRRGTRSPASGS